MSEIKLMSPAEMRELSAEGKKTFRESVLAGQKFKGIIQNIEASALKGYTGHRQLIVSNDEVRELKVIQDHLLKNGYHCEFKSERKTSILGSNYFENYFVINWGEEK